MTSPSVTPVAPKPLYTIPIADRPPHGPLFSKIFFPIFFTLAQLGIGTTQYLALPLLLIPFGIGHKLFYGIIGWTKDGYVRLCEWSPLV
jgi:lysocardiolipin and lysophospholipid acyltransferase